MRAALEEGRKLEDDAHVRGVLATFFGQAGQHNCGDHGDGGEICCGNELMRRHLDGFSDPLRPEQIPYDEDPNARPDANALSVFRGTAGSDYTPADLGVGRVKRGDHPIGRYLKKKAEAEAAARG